MVELLFKFKFIRIADYSEIRFLAPVNVIQICLQRSGYRSKTLLSHSSSMIYVPDEIQMMF